MLFDTARDWKQFLSIEDEEKLNQLLKQVAKYRGAYKNADEIKFAQLWCAILELRKENEALRRKVVFFEEIVNTAFEKLKKHDRERLELLDSLEKF
jgi:hypothetical protein